MHPLPRFGIHRGPVVPTPAVLYPGRSPTQRGKTQRLFRLAGGHTNARFPAGGQQRNATVWRWAGLLHPSCCHSAASAIRLPTPPPW